MSKQVLKPVPKIDLKEIGISDKVEIHYSRLPSFKTLLSRYKNLHNQTMKFEYSKLISEYITATRIA